MDGGWTNVALNWRDESGGGDSCEAGCEESQNERTGTWPLLGSWLLRTLKLGKEKGRL